SCPPNADLLGKAAWTLLHTTAAYYPDRPAPSQMDSMRLFMSSFIENYPCFKEEFKKEIEQEPIRVGSRKKLSEWLCRQHNKVNERLGKETFDCNLVLERWLHGSKECNQ
ncbi:hypothetical protein K501DRAFT_168467, partial [Backusella circina FSU 941]